MITRSIFLALQTRTNRNNPNKIKILVHILLLPLATILNLNNCNKHSFLRIYLLKIILNLLLVAVKLIKQTRTQNKKVPKKRAIVATQIKVVLEIYKWYANHFKMRNMNNQSNKKTFSNSHLAKDCCLPPPLTVRLTTSLKRERSTV